MFRKLCAIYGAHYTFKMSELFKIQYFAKHSSVVYTLFLVCEIPLIYFDSSLTRKYMFLNISIITILFLNRSFQICYLKYKTYPSQLFGYQLNWENIVQGFEVANVFVFFTLYKLLFQMERTQEKWNFVFVFLLLRDWFMQSQCFQRRGLSRSLGVLQTQV